MIAALNGWKTYIAAALMIAKVLIDYVLGHGINLELLLEALAIAGLRHGMAKA